MLCEFMFEGATVVVLVADQRLPGSTLEKAGFGGEEVEEGLALVGFCSGKGEGDWQALEGAYQVQAQAPEESAV